MKFYNRNKEIKILNNIKEDFRIAIIGRRRIGKTRLVEEFYKDKCINFFVSAEKAEKEIINGWVKEYTNLHLPNVDNFKEFFEFVFFHLKDKVIFIDEMQNFLKVNKSFLSDLQRLIDKHKPKLIVSGSLISIMKKIIEEYKSPLYGRFDFIIKLKELDFKTVCDICRDFGLSIEESFKIYSVFGGIPKYYELIEKLREFEFENFVSDSFIKYPRPLYEEVKTMLKEEFGKEHKTFFSILSAISQGKNKNSEIAGYLGKKETEITKYLSMLKEDYELIERDTPVISGKRGIYKIKNNIVSFWFNNIWKYNQFLETGQENKIIEILKNNLNLHISRTFEKTIYELIVSKLILPFEFTSIGRQWGKFKGEKGKNTYEIDLVAINEKNREILFGECKWQEQVNAEKIIKELNEKAKFVQWDNEKRKEYFAIFAKSFKRKISAFEGKKAYCFDLKDIKKLIEK
jgi:hypothetical protein